MRLFLIHKKYFWVSLFFLFLSFAGVAQLPKIDTDRPDQTESSYIVPKGWLQEEIGFVRFHYRSFPSEIIPYTIPTILSKYGLSKKWELRLITENERWSYNGKFLRDTMGFLPLQLGFKVNLLEEKGWRPRVSFIFHTSFNRLSARMAPEHEGSFAGPNFRFTLQNTLSEKVGLGYNIGIEWDDLDDRAALVYTVSPGFDLSEKWYAYVEIFGEFRKGEPAQHAVDGGVAYYINPNLKIDASAGFGIFGAYLRNYIGCGCSFRVPCSKKASR